MAADKRSNDARVTYLTEFELSQPQPTQPPHPMLQHERLSAIKPSTAVANSLPPETSSSESAKAMSALAISKRDDDDASTASSCSGQGKGDSLIGSDYISTYTQTIMNSWIALDPA